MFREIRDWAEELACRAGLDGLPSVGHLGRAVLLAAAASFVVWALWASGLLGTGALAAPTMPEGVGSERASAAPSIASTLTVHVVGQVRHPGVYELPGGARVRDAVDAAGGLLGAADASAVNLARVVVDGEQIAVPREGEAGAASGASGTAAGSASSRVDLNTATAAQLDALPGVGPATAAKIVADRTANGPFRAVDDLMRVSGIGPAKYDALKDLVRVN